MLKVKALDNNPLSRFLATETWKDLDRDFQFIEKGLIFEDMTNQRRHKYEKLMKNIKELQKSLKRDLRITEDAIEENKIPMKAWLIHEEAIERMLCDVKCNYENFHLFASIVELSGATEASKACNQMYFKLKALYYECKAYLENAQ